MMGALIQDLRYGLRMLAKSPGFTAAAILTLALGIGATAADFSFVNEWLIKPLPYPQAGRLMVLVSHDKKKGWSSIGMSSTADFLDYQKQNTSFERTAAWAGWSFNLTGDGPPALVDGGRVSWNFFDTLGAKPLLGRTFTPDEDRPGTGHVAILGEGLWKSRYAGDPRIIGRTIAISDESYTVVGVMPGKFQFPLLGASNLWTPLALTDKERADRSNSWFSSAFGRLKRGVTEAQASAEASAIFARFEKEYPQTNTNMTLLLSPMTYEIGKGEGANGVMILSWVVGLILLIACANVASLMLARASRRTKEFAMRGALGATRGRLARQLLTESLLLFFFGAVGGAHVGVWGLSWIEAQIPAHVRGHFVNYGYVSLDMTTLGFTLGIALLCGLIFGVAPAVENSRLDLIRILKEASGQASGSKRGARLRRIFVDAEIALAVVVLISTTLLVKSFIISVRSDPGYNPVNVMVAQLVLPKANYAQESRQRNFVEDVLARLRGLSRAVSASAASSVPFGGFGDVFEVEAVGKPAPQPGEILGARFTAVSPDYFRVMQIALVKGRAFTFADAPGAPSVAVIDQTLAKQFWPDKDPLGQELQFGPQHTVCAIVGVVNDIKMYQLRARPERQLYVPLAQFPSATLGFVVRAPANAPPLPTAIHDAIWSVDRDQPVSSVEGLDELMATQNAGYRMMTKLMIYFSALALFLGAIGIYGVMSQLVSHRTHEIGIRMALGASPPQVMCMVIGQALKLTMIGIALGMLAALATTRSLAALLYQVSPSDPLTFVLVPVMFAMVALAACYIPARRAMRVDPMVALRYE